MNQYFSQTDPIAAIASGGGSSAIAIIRCSGQGVISLIKKVFKPKNPTLDIEDKKGYTQVYGSIHDGEQLIDEVILSIYKSPNSYTGEDAVEISCHGSTYIQQKILEVLQTIHIRMATGGEFTMRAYANGKFDLAQAEAVADIIESQSKWAHQIAMRHHKGHYSDTLKSLRQELIDLVSLLELELDFSEEDVEFADRQTFKDLLVRMAQKIQELVDSYRLGSVIIEGIPVAIIGKPNVGKSTLLNKLLKEDRAIVSNIPGTTRDVIEDKLNIDGHLFRIIDTAGIHKSDDTIEKLGIERSLDKIEEADIILYLTDEQGFDAQDVSQINNIEKKGKFLLKVINKADKLGQFETEEPHTIKISAKSGIHLESIHAFLLEYIETFDVQNHSIVTNARHIEILKNTLNIIREIQNAFEMEIPTDLISIDVREALNLLGEITGEVSTEDILGNIFGKFCIGK